VYRLGRHGASGVMTLSEPPSRGEIFVLRRGHVITGEGELARRACTARLARLASLDRVIVHYEGGVPAYPPGAQLRQLYLGAWARAHLEAQLDAALAERLVHDLAGMRLALRPELAPDPAHCDEADRRMLAAMAQPRRLDQIWPLSRTPRFRLLAFLHFLRGVEALEVEGVVAERSAPHRAVDPRRVAALRLLGVADGADADAIKRAYRRLARALHPDLQPEADEARRRAMGMKFAEVAAAYECLAG
jgi:DnaJ-domain-containing protein 1